MIAPSIFSDSNFHIILFFLSFFSFSSLFLFSDFSALVSIWCSHLVGEDQNGKQSRANMETPKNIFRHQTRKMSSKMMLSVLRESTFGNIKDRLRVEMFQED